MKFMNVIKKFKNHQDYVDYRNELIDAAAAILENGELEEYKAALEEVKLYDQEYQDFQNEQANITAIRNGAQAPNVLTATHVNGVVDTFNNSIDNDLAYRQAFMNMVVNGIAIPAEFKNADAFTTTSDVGAVIPKTILGRIIELIENTGLILSKVTRTNFKGGVTVPTSAAKPSATWTTERGTTDKQKKSLGSITFTYHKLRCVVAVGIITDIVTLDVFESTLAKNIAEAMVKALETAIVNGTGTNEPKGVLAETANGNVDIGKTASITYANLNAAEALLPVAYEGGAEWYMTKSTFFNQVSAMTDTAGQPVARATVGINGKPQYNILGRPVNFISQLPDHANSPTADTVFAFIYNFEDYLLNTNLNVTVKKYVDETYNDQITKAIMIADGKSIDVHSLITLTKKSS